MATVHIGGYNFSATLSGTTGNGQPYYTIDTTSSAGVGGPTAADAPLTANPVTIGGRAATANPTAVANADVVNTMHDKLGKLVAVSALRALKGIQKTTITSSTAETTIVTAGAAGVFVDVFRLVIANTSASPCNVTIKDATAGTTRYILAVPAGQTVGFSGDCGSAAIQATAANNWTATCSASVASIEITAEYVANL